MREVTRITFNRRSKKFNLRIYDEDTGWQNVKCDDADSLVDTARTSSMTASTRPSAVSE